MPQPARPPGVAGEYHCIVKGQTLWRIAKYYGVDLDEIVRINNIPDAASIEVGQRIFIPKRNDFIPKPPVGESDDFIWPLKGRVISAFGQLRNNMVNKGLDIKPQAGCEVVAARSGKVVFVAEGFSRFGRVVIVEHPDGISTVYARNSQIFCRAGESVKAGQVIARAGSTVDDSEVYVHFEVRKGAVAQNPYYYLP